MSQRLRRVWRETRAAVEEERYTVGGRTVDLSGALAAMRAGTRIYPPEELRDLDPSRGAGRGTRFEVTDESTLEALTRVSGSGEVAALNFASARNPGGGVANGARAQEESLARSSGLYASLTACPEFYDHHRRERSLLYTDRVIHSPSVPVFRDDRGGWLPQPVVAAFLTCAAPNRRMVERNATGEADRIPGVLARRSRGVLAVAADRGADTLVLGAWGCGVFGNRPAEVAGAFAEHLDGEFAGVFGRVVFAVTGDDAVRSPFREAFGTS
ncbi:TIGR02452 family protein [Nocardiopsis sp. FIRDI 009]|uniref:TIGR02452 family protein n=1 Tax=Nocardiopsis sp. FIRDI 009 TaxID=714197 RepID=UPI000E223470|nr:TIGR02452 family protein [Nocardiopsis sp. FIRDI 009]